MSTALEGQTVPGVSPEGHVLNAFKQGGGAPPSPVLAANPRGLPEEQEPDQTPNIPTGQTQTPTSPVDTGEISQTPPGGGVSQGPPGPTEQIPKPAKVKKPAPPPTLTPAILKRIGPRPEDPTQAAIHDRIAKRLGTEMPDAVPLVPERHDNGDFKLDSSKKNPAYQLHSYNIVNSPMLGKKALKIDKEGNLEKPTVADTSVADEFKYLGPTDKRRLSYMHGNGGVDAFADKLVDDFNEVKDDPNVLAAKGWYKEAAEALVKHFGEHAEFFAQLLAATSPQQGVVQNFKDALEAYNRFRRGDFDDMIRHYQMGHEMRMNGKLLQHMHENGISQAMLDKNQISSLPKTEAAAFADWMEHHQLFPRKSDNQTKYGLNSDKVMKVLASTWLTESGGPKTLNYVQNLSGKSLQATIDMWAARTMRRLGYEGYSKKPWLLHPPQEMAVNKLDFAFSQLAFRKAAERLGMTPHELQAMLWYKEQYKWIKEKRMPASETPEKKDYRPILAAYQPEHPKATKAHHWELGMPIAEKASKV